MFNKNTTTQQYMSIVLTHECNRNCPFCVDMNRGGNEYISMLNVKNAIAFAKSNNIKDILLVGGEPSLHPKVVEIAKLISENELNIIFTTNYSKPDVIKQLDKYVSSFNISFYNQDELPDQDDFKADITLSTLIHNKQLNTKDKLDNFINKYKYSYILKFSTLSNCNEWTDKNYKVSYLDELIGDRFVLFNEILGQEYNGYIIKRYDVLLNRNADQSYKCHVDGRISQEW